MTQPPHFPATRTANGASHTTSTRTTADSELSRIMATLETLQMEVRHLVGQHVSPPPAAAAPLLAPDPKAEILSLVQAANDGEHRGLPTAELRELMGFNTRARLAHYLYALEDDGAIIVVRGKQDRATKRRGSDIVYLASVLSL